MNRSTIVNTQLTKSQLNAPAVSADTLLKTVSEAIAENNEFGNSQINKLKEKGTKILEDIMNEIHSIEDRISKIIVTNSNNDATITSSMQYYNEVLQEEIDQFNEMESEIQSNFKLLEDDSLNLKLQTFIEQIKNIEKAYDEKHMYVKKEIQFATSEQIALAKRLLTLESMLDEQNQLLYGEAQ